MKRLFFSCCLFMLFFLSNSISSHAQQVMDLDSSLTPNLSITLPPLDLLFENAKNAPTYQVGLVQEAVEKSLLRKEKRAFLGFFSMRGSWQYGKFANDIAYSDVSQPIINSYNSAAQTAYSVGAAVSINLEDLFDLGARVKRQKLNVRKAELLKEQSFEAVKKEIVELYSMIKSQLNIFKLRAEAVVLANEQYKIMEKNFANGTASSLELANQKEYQSMAIQHYEESKFELNKSIMVLEIITNTTIVKK